MWKLIIRFLSGTAATAIIFGTWQQTVWASTLHKLPFEQILCRDRLIQTLTQWNAVGPWRALPSERQDQQVFQAETDRTGVWVQIQKNENQTAFATKVTAHLQIGLRWNPATCQPEAVTAHHDFFPTTLKEDFTDENLAALLRSRPQGGVVLTWSPAMPYSFDAIQNVQMAASRLKTQVTFVLDSEMNRKTALGQSGPRAPAEVVRNRSMDLMMRGMQNHFPSVLIYQKGHIISPVLPGLNSADAYEKFLRKYLK